MIAIAKIADRKLSSVLIKRSKITASVIPKKFMSVRKLLPDDNFGLNTSRTNTNDKKEKIANPVWPILRRKNILPKREKIITANNRFLAVPILTSFLMLVILELINWSVSND